MGQEGGSGHRSQRYKTQNHKSQSFQMMISQITDNNEYMHQYFILVLVSILTALKYLKPQMKMVILCMIAKIFLLVIRPVGHKSNS